MAVHGVLDTTPVVLAVTLLVNIAPDDASAETVERVEVLLRLFFDSVLKYYKKNFSRLALSFWQPLEPFPETRGFHESVRVFCARPCDGFLQREHRHEA